MGKFQELNLIILRLRMNNSCNDTNLLEVLHFWVEICIKPPNIEVILCGQMVSETFRPPRVGIGSTFQNPERNLNPIPTLGPPFPTYRG